MNTPQVTLTMVANGSYRNAKGTKVFRYVLAGSEAELARYKEVQGTFYRENADKKALYFTNRYAGDRGTLIITEKGKVLADMSKFDAAASLASQYGGNFGTAIASALVSNLLGTPSAPAATAPVAEATTDIEPAAEEADLDQH